MPSEKRSSRSKGEDTNPDYNLPGIGNYVFQKTVGEGNFAKVKLAKHKLTGQEVAIKVIDKTQLDEKKLSKLYREVRIMKLLHHPNIVRLYEVIETKSTIFLVMEYSSGGELYDYLVVHGRMKEKEARAKFRQILSAVSYCHKKKVIHRDLKAENLLLDENLDIKIADFGFSNHFDPDGKLDTFCGSPPYAAPELFQGRRYVGPEVDIWSLGVILYVLCTGCLPFDGKNLQEMRESVCRGKYRIPFYLSESCEKLLRKFLVRDSTKRASLDIILDDPWINEGYTESPIVADLSQNVDEDETVIRIMETKFHIERDAILKALRENVYDDVAAIYHLLYHERDLKGDHGEIKKLDQPSTGSSTKEKPNPMTKIEEDAVLASVARTETNTADKGAPSPGGRRARRFTVTGTDNNNVQKMMDDKEKEVKPLLKKEELEIRQRNETPKELEDYVNNVEPEDEKAAEEEKKGRRRTQTIVGIFRRKQSDGSEVQTPEAGVPIHQAADAEGKPRSLRFTFNSNTTSSKPPDDVITEVLSGCAKLSIQTKLLARYLIQCSYASDSVMFEVEVCKLPRLKNIHGLRFKRVNGSTGEYKDICEKLLSAIAL